MAPDAAPRLQRSRWILVLCGYAIAVAVVHWLLTRSQHPQIFWDSSAYTEEARQPFTLTQFFYPKPIFVSLVMRVIGTDAGRVAHFQGWFSLISWLCLTAALVTSLATTRARVVTLLAGASLTLDPFRLGYGSAILSESINDSLLALLVAAVLVVCTWSQRRLRVPGLVVTTVLAACWLLTRDTNAVIALVAIAVALLWWRPSPRRHVRELVAFGVVAVVAVFVLWSTNVRPGNTKLTFQGQWPPEFRARVTYSMMNNIVDRVLPDPAARRFFVERGLPEMSLDSWPAQRESVIVDPALVPVRDWIANHAQHVWLMWLLSTPGSRIQDQWEHRWQLMGVANDEHLLYMPRHWKEHGMLAPLRRLWSTHGVIAMLVLALPALLYVGRRHRLMALIAAMIAGGWLASVASYYGDPAEIGRHCYGSGQLVILGLVFALLLCVESLQPLALRLRPASEDSAQPHRPRARSSTP